MVSWGNPDLRLKKLKNSLLTCLILNEWVNLILSKMIFVYEVKPLKDILTVYELNHYMKQLVLKDKNLSNIFVKGEISNFKNHSSGHMYFTLKDENSAVKGIMFKSQNLKLKFVPENGMKVIITGYISIYERDGQYQLYAQDMQPDGIGSLHIAFEQLKKKLEEKGFFDTTHKKKIPFLPKSIGVVTSSTGAVIRDIINVLNRRYQNFNLKIFPVPVQGQFAAEQISKAIRKINELNCVDVIIVARGGGSLEELWAFNEEVVATSIFNSIIPVISAVGHETDFTISDFVADLRAPTPSAAAELVLPEKAMIINKIDSLKVRMNKSQYYYLNKSRSKLDNLAKSYVFRQPYEKIYQHRMKLDIISKYMYKGLISNKENCNKRFESLVGKLNALSPLNILSRGYGIVKSKQDGSVLKSITDIKVLDDIEISIKDGNINCVVNSIERREFNG